MLIALPVLMILLLGTIQFGMLHANLQQLAVASRHGAREAARTAGLAAAGTVPANVQAAVDRQLQSAGLGGCRIYLEHNTLGMPATLSAGSCACSPPAGTLPADRVVRISVCVEVTDLTPNLLKMFGFDLSGRVARQTTVFPYEL